MGINIDQRSTAELSEMCITCVKSKMTKLLFTKNSDKKMTSQLELIHSHMWAYHTIDSWWKTFFKMFLDDYIYFIITNRSEVFECFKYVEAIVKTKFGMQIASSYCDNVNNIFQIRLVTSPSRRKFRYNLTTVPYTPELNGKAERLNRALLERHLLWWSNQILTKTCERSLWKMAVGTQLVILIRCSLNTPCCYDPYGLCFTL